MNLGECGPGDLDLIISVRSLRYENERLMKPVTEPVPQC